MQWIPHLRTLLARRPWIWWLVIALLAAALAATVAGAIERLDAERASWGQTASVVVAARDIALGEALAGSVESVDLPIALVPASSLTSVAPGAIAVQRLARGEVIVEIDVARSDGAAALVPDGWVAIAIEVSTTHYFGLGDRAVVFAEGTTVTATAIVTDVDDGHVVVAVPAETAPAVAEAAVHGTAVVALSGR